MTIVDTSLYSVIKYYYVDHQPTSIIAVTLKCWPYGNITYYYMRSFA